ncbi:uncharacterized protein [Drosophila kikkawai]|uniref:Uncharacterized protein isoform X1 n=1 Tax=Drosophila kikkawai TaxID=30033 RepID=A0ABM3C4W2_DROKI|nr:uncharacterized protein LOC121502066 [Drosophila kikkawai]
MQDTVTTNPVGAEQYPSYLSALNPLGMNTSKRHRYRPENIRDPRINKIKTAYTENWLHQQEQANMTSTPLLNMEKENVNLEPGTTSPPPEPLLTPKIEEPAEKPRGTELERLLLTSPTPFSRDTNKLLVKSLQDLYKRQNDEIKRQLLEDSEDESEDEIPLKQLVYGKPNNKIDRRQLKLTQMPNKPITRLSTGASASCATYRDKPRRRRNLASQTQLDPAIRELPMPDENSNNQETNQLADSSLQTRNYNAAANSDETTLEEQMPCSSVSLRCLNLTPNLGRDEVLSQQAPIQTQTAHPTTEETQTKESTRPTKRSRRRNNISTAKTAQRGDTEAARYSCETPCPRRRKPSLPTNRNCDCGIENFDETMLKFVNKANKAIIKIIESINKTHRQCRDTNDNIEIFNLKGQK